MKPNPRTRASVPDIRKDVLNRLPWLDHVAFHINEGLYYDGRAFGVASGLPENTSPDVLLHEISHSMELTLLPSRIWKRRIKRPNFELTIKTVQNIAGQIFEEPSTMQATERECRVAGMQLRLLEAAGYDTGAFFETFVEELVHVKDSHYGGESIQNTHLPNDYSAGQRAWVQCRVDLIQASYNIHTLDDLKARWLLVMNWLAKAKPLVEA